MAVRLVAYTKATPEFEAEGLTDLQELIAFCAKVSNPTAQINSETSERLIKYLIKHQHWSPLEMVNACLEITQPATLHIKLCDTVVLRFRSLVSVMLNPADQGELFEYSEARLQDPVNRQNSIECGPDHNSTGNMHKDVLQY